jgi:4'-phosphopantetheinyl transferase
MTVRAISGDWSSPPTDLRLGEHDVHLWRASLDSGRASLGTFETVLSADEHTRAARFIFPSDRDRFIVGRGVLRFILGQYTKQPAAAVSLTTDAQSKPRLRASDSATSLCFNVSHSQGIAVYAIARGRELGVDIEALRADVAAEEIAERFFSSTELAELRKLPPDRRDEGFLLCWTRKEAYVKALGAGLAIPLDSFTVSLTPNTPEVLRSADADRWTLRSFTPRPGYVGALVVEGNRWGLRLFDWPGRG